MRRHSRHRSPRHYSIVPAIRNAAAAFRALVPVSRLHILEGLAHRERCVGDLQRYLDVPQPDLSASLQKLKDAQLVTARRDAQWVYYRINPVALDELIGFLQSLKERPRPEDCSLDCCQRL